jgi:hypothetical protein
MITLQGQGSSLPGLPQAIKHYNTERFIVLRTIRAGTSPALTMLIKRVFIPGE